MDTLLNLLGTLGTLYAALAAACALWTWRTQLVAERQASLAQEALADAYAFEEFFSAALDEQGAANTPVERERLYDHVGKTDRLDMYHAARRILKTGQPELQGRLKLMQHRLRAAFGDGRASDAIGRMWSVRDEALGTLLTLHALAEQGRSPWSTGKDKVTVDMHAAILDLERECRPALDAQTAASKSLCDRLFDWLTRRAT